MHPTRAPGPSIVWKPMLVCPQPEIARQVRSALAELGAPEPVYSPEYPRMGTLAAAAAQHGSNICFLDVSSNPEHAGVLIGEAAGSLPVVALSLRADADIILRCLRRGACEFLSEHTAEAVRGVFDRLARARAPLPARPAGALYCVVPGKVGCGASTLAAHLAVHMAAGGAARALLVDADPLAASITFLLKLKSEFHLGDVVRDWKRMDEDLWHRLIVGACGIDVLPAPEHASSRLEIGREMAAEMAAFWRERYETTVVDTADVRDAAESGFAAAADQVLLVTTNELAALHATRRAIAYLGQALRDRERIRLIVNRYTPASGLQRADVKTAIQMDPFAVLSNDYELIQSALLDGRPAPAASRFGASVRALGLHLRGATSEPEAPSWRLFFRARK